MDPELIITNESLLLKMNKKSSRRAPAKAAGLHLPINSLLDFYWFLLIPKDGARFGPKMLHFHVLNPLGPELEIKLFAIGRS